MSSSNAYAQHLGGTSTFSGLVIGIPTVFSGVALLPLMKLDRGIFQNFISVRTTLAKIVRRRLQDTHALRLWIRYAWSYFICSGISDQLFVPHSHWSYRVRIQLHVLDVFQEVLLRPPDSWNPSAYNTRRMAGSWAGDRIQSWSLRWWSIVRFSIHVQRAILTICYRFKVGFSNSVFNGYTSPAWIMAGVWAAFWIFAGMNFQDIPAAPSPSTSEMELNVIQPTPNVSAQSEANPSKSRETLQAEPQTQMTEVASVERIADPPIRHMSAPQWGVTATMCWFAMTCFFILGAWEANIPVFTDSDSPLSPFHFSPFAAGNLIALGGACTFPFLLLNVSLARRHQDRNTLAIGTSLGAVGLFIALAILKTGSVNYGSLFICWFLVALGFNLSSTVTLSLLSKQLPAEWNTRISVAIQYSNYTGRVTGAVWGGAGVKVGMLSYVSMQIAIVGVGTVMFCTLWRDLKAKTG